MNKQDINHIKNIFPSLKIILVLRNPVDRAWSQTRFYMTRNKLDQDNNNKKLKEFIDSPIQTTRSDYIQILNNWSSCFPKDQIFIGFYDDTINDNKVFVNKICEFLHIDKNFIIESSVLEKRVNVSLELDMPFEINEHLKIKYKKEIEYLKDRFGITPESGILN